MRLIDAYGSFTINANDNTDYSLAFGGGIISVADEYGHIAAEFDADDFPAIDAVPVVRCRECKNHRECNGYHYCKFWRMYCPDDSDFFCKAGGRKDGDE